MDHLYRAIDATFAFLDAGGPVLWAILALSVLLWVLILERFFYYRFSFPPIRQHCLGQWQNRTDRSSWRARRIREAMISENGTRLTRTLPMIRTLIAICPLLGLLGTITGMIDVFDVINWAGTGNPRAMASGISRATIPTMAGMVVGIAGLWLSARFEHTAKTEIRHLADVLT